MIKLSDIILDIELVSVPGSPRNLLPCQMYVVSTHVFQSQLSLKTDCCYYFKSSKEKIPDVLNKVLVCHLKYVIVSIPNSLNYYLNKPKQYRISTQNKNSVYSHIKEIIINIHN